MIHKNHLPFFVRIISAFLCVFLLAGNFSFAADSNVTQTASEQTESNSSSSSTPQVTVTGTVEVGQTLTAVLSGTKSTQTVVKYKWTFGSKVYEYTDTPSIKLTQQMYDSNSLELVVVLQNPSAKVSYKTTFHIENGLPVVYINTDDGREVTSKSTYKGASMMIELSDGTAEYTNLFTEDFAAIEIRGRGNSTWGRSKKPYKLKLSEKADLFGMGSSKHWILLANAYDGSQLRNMLSYDLSDALGLVAVKNIHVNLVFNGEFVGLYQLTENIRAEKGRVPVTNWESVAEDAAEAIGKTEGLKTKQIENLAEEMKKDLGWITSGKYKNYVIADYFDLSGCDTTGGYIIELDEYYDEVSKFITPEDVPIMIKSPEYLVTNDDMFGYIRDYIVDMEDALFSSDGYNSDGCHYSDYLDVDSFVDYWIVNQAFKSVELLFKSCFMYKDAGGKITFGPVWDMDWSSGNHANLGGVCADPTAWNHNQSQDREYWYRAIYHLPYFVVQLEDRWWEVRDKIQDMLDSIDSTADYLSDAADDDYAIWGGIGGWKFSREVSELKTWLNKRVEWMDKQLVKRDPDIMWLGIEESGLYKMTVSDSTGYTVPADTVSDSNRAADLYYDGGGEITVTVEVSDSLTKSLDVYVNGIKVKNAALSGGKATFTVDTTTMNYAKTGKRNVIHVIGRNANNSLTPTGEKYVSLYVTGTPVYQVTYKAGADGTLGVTPSSAQYTAGATFTLPSPTMTLDGCEFAGWSDGTKTYAAGDSVTVGTKAITFTAQWTKAASTGTKKGAIIIASASAVAIGGAGAFAFVRLKKKA